MADLFGPGFDSLQLHRIRQCHSVIFNGIVAGIQKKIFITGCLFYFFTMLRMISYEQQSKLQDIVRGAILKG